MKVYRVGFSDSMYVENYGYRPKIIFFAEKPNRWGQAVSLIISDSNSGLRYEIQYCYDNKLKAEKQVTNQRGHILNQKKVRIG
ncbi:MAG: hypothetical protein WHV28_09620 [Bacteroidota bacterium]